MLAPNPPASSLGTELFKVAWPFVLGFLLMMVIGIISIKLIMALRRERRRLEQTLAAERKPVAVTLACLGETVISTDEQGPVTYMNSVARTLTQQALSPGETANQPCALLLGLVHLIEQDSGTKRLPHPPNPPKNWHQLWARFRYRPSRTVV